MSTMVFTNAVRFSAEPMLVEKKTEPVHPPIESAAFTPYGVRNMMEESMQSAN